MTLGGSDHPRIRGEHPKLPDRPLRRRGSSPHTRGARSQQPGRADDGGIIPAYAGSTARCRWLSCPGRDHPRIRGEHLAVHVDRGGFGGSSPHTRGARLRQPRQGQRPGIIPAYAGSTPCRVRLGGRGADHPRIRGEHWVAWVVSWPLTGSSPHTRGALKSTSTPPATLGDHPRIRGEHGSTR